MNTVFVAERASVPSSPVRPNVQLNVTIGVLMGLLLMAAAVALVEYLDDGINDREDIEALGAPFLGSIFQADLPKGEDAKTWRPSILNIESRSPLAESYQQLRTNLAFSLSADDSKALLFTSSMPAEGKSTMAANVAEALSESAKRVLVIDGDLRKPDLHRYFEFPNTSGLSSIFLGEVQEAESYLRKVSDQLDVLTSGPLPPNPTELLSSPKLGAILGRLVDNYDHIVIDSPPLLGLADASLWANHADGVILVARRGRTRRGQLQESILAATATHKPLIGVILNSADRRRMAGYYYEYSYAYRPEETDS